MLFDKFQYVLERVKILLTSHEFIQCKQGCTHRTRRLTNEERVDVHARLAIAAGIVRDLQKLLGTYAYAG